MSDVGDFQYTNLIIIIPNNYSVLLCAFSELFRIRTGIITIDLISQKNLIHSDSSLLVSHTVTESFLKQKSKLVMDEVIFKYSMKHY